MSTHFDGTTEEKRILDAYIKLIRATESIHARLISQLKKWNLTVSQLGVLESLLHLGPMCQTELSRKILKTTGNLTLVIDNLEKRGLVRRIPFPGDRRRYDITLTDKGEDFIREIFPKHVNAIVERFQILTPGEQVELARLCKKLGTSQSLQ